MQSDRFPLVYPLEVEKLIIKEGGHLLIGQEQDTVAGKFEVKQSINGDIGNLVLYNTTLSIQQMKRYIACLSFSEDLEPLVQFDDSMTGLSIKGPSRVYNLTLDEVCRKAKHEELVMFASKMEFNEAFAWCELLGGMLVVPLNEKENKKVYNAFVPVKDKCMNSWGTFIWIGLKGNISTKQWHNAHHFTPLSWSNFHPAFALPKLPRSICVTMGKAMADSKWIASPCDEKTCPFCRFKMLPVLRLQGPCIVSEFDHYFTIKNDGNNEPVFLGYYRSRIIKDGNTGTWKLESTISGRNSFAVLKSDNNVNYPVGRYTWNISNHKCGFKMVR